MQIDPIARTVRLSVRELAAFRNLPGSSVRGGSAWRAEVGRNWHKTAETEAQAQHAQAAFEVPLRAQWRHRDWTFDFQGRIDQLLPRPGGGQILREVKTIRSPLPADASELATAYPAHIAQAATYLALARVLPQFQGIELVAELLFINIETGILQILPLDAPATRQFEVQLDAIIPFLEDRRNSRLKFQSHSLQPAFSVLREGQAELFALLEKSTLAAKTVLLEAPTGFGKTGIVLEHSLRQMQNGLFERCIYLTSKSTGQLETIRQLRAISGGSIRYLQMRNRAEHRIESPAHTCTGDARCDSEGRERTPVTTFHMPEFLTEDTLTLDQARTLGAETGICPYALSKATLPYADLWIGDSNYVFAPGSRSVFFEVHDFDPARTLLVVDEAHNLPTRAADALSVELRTGDLLFALEALHTAGAPRRLLSIGQELGRFIEAQSIGQALSTNAHYEALDLCEDFARQLAQARYDPERLAPSVHETIWQIPELAHRLGQPAHQWLHWLPASGRLLASCLDASPWIAECLEAFGGSILMSATLSPTDRFRESCGLSAKDCVLAPGHAPWRDDAYDVAIDCRVDTRLKHREHHYATTAATVAQLVAQSPGVPIAVFFASYQYAENILTYLQVVDPGARVQLQPRGVDLAAQEAFIDEGLLLADALFLILGSSYSEGVDKLGGRVDTVMIVGPALPEVNPLQEAKMAAHPTLSREAAFKAIYVLPAMQRIHQALGRIIRAPGQRAKVLLHCKRYAESTYHPHLAPEYQSNTNIRTTADLINWLQASSS